MAQPRAVVDIVGAETLANEFLEEIGFLIGALGRTETAECGAAIAVEDFGQAGSCPFHRFFPGRFAKDFVHLSERISRVGDLGCIVAADHRLGEPFRAHYIVHAEAALDAEFAAVGRTLPPVDGYDIIALDAHLGLAANAAEGADAVDLLFGIDLALHRLRVEKRTFHQRAGRAGLHALTASHTGAQPHWVVNIESRQGLHAAPLHSDHVIDLHLAAGAFAETT